MDENNPYSAPSANLGGKDSFGERIESVSHGVVGELSRTKGWTRFVAILAFLFALVVVGVAVMSSRIFALYAQNYWGIGFERFLPFVIGIAVVVGGVAIAYGSLLWGFSSAVNRLVESGSESDLAIALDRQRKFWVLSGVLSIIGALFTVFGFIA